MIISKCLKNIKLYPWQIVPLMINNNDKVILQQLYEWISHRNRIRYVLIRRWILVPRLQIYQIRHLKPISSRRLDLQPQLPLQLTAILLLSLPIRKNKQIGLGRPIEHITHIISKIIILQNMLHLSQYPLLPQNPLLRFPLTLSNQFKGKTVRIIIVLQWILITNQLCIVLLQ